MTARSSRKHKMKSALTKPVFLVLAGGAVGAYVFPKYFVATDAFMGNVWFGTLAGAAIGALIANLA